jgi:hypothetical protein
MVLSDSPSLNAPLVQSTAATRSANSSLENKFGSTSTLVFRVLPSPTGLRFATFFPRAGPLGSGDAGTLEGPEPPGGPRLGPLGPGDDGPLEEPEPPGGPRLGPLGPGDDGPLEGPEPPGGPRLGLVPGGPLLGAL